MKFLERYWWVIVAIVALYLYANSALNTVDTTFSGLTGNVDDPTADNSGGSPSTMGNNFWIALGGAAALVLLL